MNDRKNYELIEKIVKKYRKTILDAVGKKISDPILIQIIKNHLVDMYSLDDFEKITTPYQFNKLVDKIIRDAKTLKKELSSRLDHGRISPYHRRQSYSIDQLVPPRETPGTLEPYEINPIGEHRSVASHFDTPVGTPRGKGVIPPLKKGDLTRFGYHFNESATVRHRALDQAVSEYGGLPVFHKVLALAVLNKNKPNGSIPHSDLKYLKKYLKH
jgi:hypothetical protein